MEANKTKIRTFLLQFIRKPDLQDDENIFTTGFVNSLFAMQLILFIEKEFAVKVKNEDLKIENFNTINAITRLVERKRENFEN